MSDSTPQSPGKPGGCALAACIIVLSLAALPWMGELSSSTTPRAGDAAGHALSAAFDAIFVVLLWILLAIAIVIAAISGAVPAPAVLPGFLLIPFSCVCALQAADLLDHSVTPPYRWPIVVLAIVPPLIALFCFWSLVPRARRVVPMWYAAGIVWGGTLLVSAAVWPMREVKQAVAAAEMRESEKIAAAYAALPADAPVWDLVPFMATRSDIRQDEILQRMRGLDRRQSDAELMLDRGDFPLRWIGQMDLTQTPVLCDRARALLRKQVEPLVLRPGEVTPYVTIFWPVSGAHQALQWLIGYGCDARPEAKAWETMANAYVNPGWDVHELGELQDPKELGRLTREQPTSFDMVTPRSHLRVWLKFANDPPFRERALAGARNLDHRTTDAVEMLNGDEFAAWDMLIFLPDLDLEATPELCQAASREVHRELSLVYQPKPDDPRPYQELLDRMGTGQPLRALMWLSPHGCDSEAEVSEAEELARSYQDSPDRRAMLATLAALHRKP